MGAILSAAMFSAASRAATVQEVQSRGKLIVISFPHSSSEFIRDAEGGGYEGLDYDVMKAFATKLGVELEIHPVGGYGELIPALLRGEGDVIASSFTITDERREQARFCKQYFPAAMMVVVRQDSSISSIEDLAGRIASTLRGSSQEARLQEIGGIRFRHVTESARHYTAIVDGDADFALIDSTAALSDLVDWPQLKIAFRLPEVYWYGYAVAPGSDLCDELDARLDAMKKGDYFYKLVLRYFGEKGVEVFKIIESAGQ
jgi:ABC-type amino acid transport substrate-binding protein